MKTSEFLTKLKKYCLYRGHSYGDDGFIYIKNGSDTTVLTISKKEQYMLSTAWAGFDILFSHERKEVTDIALEYSATPIPEREEQKLYRAVSKIDEDVYVKYEKFYEIFFLGSLDNCNEYTRFEHTEQQLRNVNGINVFESDEWEIKEVKE